MADARLSALTYAVRGRVVMKYLGQLALTLAVLCLVPLAASLFFAEHALSLRYLVVLLVLVGAGTALARLPAPGQVQINEALAVTALAFVLAPLLMSYPMMGAGLSFVDALFESVSGVTTTGLSTLTTIEDRPRSFLLARAWMQWYGGLGIAVLSVTLVIGHHVAARRLVDPEPAATENLVTTTRTHARRVLAAYVLLTALGVLALWLLRVDGFTALTHTLAAVSTGGFSTFDDSVAGLESYPASFLLAAIAFCSAVSLPLYHRAYRRGLGELVTDPELRALLIAVLVVSGLLGATMSGADGTVNRAAAALFLGISAQTTTGFSNVTVAELEPAAKLVLIGSMAVGGSVGSTAGGIKLLRLLILLRLIQLAVRRAGMPRHAVAQPWLGRHRLENDDIERALMMILLMGGVIFLSWIPFVALGYDPLDALFEVVSATGTVGLSTGITQADLPTLLKGILCLDMLLGRLEVIALLVVLYPATWLGKRTKSL